MCWTFSALSSRSEQQHTPGGAPHMTRLQTCSQCLFSVKSKERAMSPSDHKRAPITNFYIMNAGGTAVQKRTNETHFHSYEPPQTSEQMRASHLIIKKNSRGIIVTSSRSGQSDMMSGINRAQPPRWVVSGTLFHGGVNLLLSGLCPEPTRGVWSPLRSPQMWGWKTLQILVPKSVAGLSLSFFPAPPLFSQICCLLCFLF